MEDNRLERLVELGKDKNDKTYTGNQLLITISDTLPIVILDDALVDNNKVLETNYNGNSDGEEDDNKNYLIDRAYEDKNSKERFIYVTRVNSGVSNNFVRLYYDRKYNDIIVIPNLEYINQNAKGKLYSIQASRIGGGAHNKNEVASDLVLSRDSVFKLPETKENVDNKHYFMRLHGISTSSLSNFYISVDGDHRVRDKKLAPTGMLSLGSMSDLFVNEEVLPSFTVYQITADRYVSKYLGNVIPDNIYIPLTF